MRGKLHKRGLLRGSLGITPAHAGKTCSDRKRNVPSGDHPRACGENGACFSITTGIMGSPPRMRGKRGGSGEKGALGGITPAHAGKTRRPPPRSSAKRDHPRACGENCSLSSHQSDTMGSPPRMRGKPLDLVIVVCALGITPAHAGKTAADAAGESVNGDHPRACGENKGGFSTRRTMMGSPPRMRGKRRKD